MTIVVSNQELGFDPNMRFGRLLGVSELCEVEERLIGGLSVGLTVCLC